MPLRGCSQTNVHGRSDGDHVTARRCWARIGEVAIAGFGKFSVSNRAAREGRNPATGETIQIAASNVAKFSAASALKNTLNAR